MNNDGNLIPKLTPQNAEQEYMVQILLAMMQGFCVEVDYGAGWTKAVILLHDGNFKYRINPNPTPLPTSREMWGFIDKKWRFMAMDRSKLIYLYEEKPTASDGMWLPEDGSYSQCPLNINTDGINWEKSLTERPEGV